MKMVNILFLFVLIAFSSVVHAQILEQSDIDIFVGGFSILDRDFNDYGFEEYQDRIDDVYDDVFNVDFGDSPPFIDDFNGRRERWLAFLDIEAPKKIEAAFREMGWETNGHKKLFIIMYGLIMLLRFEDLEYWGGDVLLDLFHKLDLRLIKDNMDVLIDVIGY